MYVAALLLVMFPLLTGFQRCGPSPRMLYISRKESPELNITHLRDRSQSFFLRTFYCPMSEVYWMPCWLIFYWGELVFVQRQHPITSIIEAYLALDSSLFLAMNTQTRAQQIAILQRTWRRTRRTWRLTVQPRQMKGLRICYLNVRTLSYHLKEVNVLTKLWTVFMSLSIYCYLSPTKLKSWILY